MIKFKNINKIFYKNKRNELHVLKDINLELPNKGLVVLLGESGSGKTTMLNLMSGMEKQTSGSVTVKNHEMSKYKQSEWTDIRNFNIGYVYQNYLLKKDETVFDNIAFALRISSKLTEEDIESRVEYLLSKVGLAGLGKRFATQLSGGQKQRVAIARALANNPDIILADEPTGNLDSRTSIDIMNIFKEITKDKLVVVVTHETALAEFYANRIIHIASGQIVKDVVNNQEGDLSVIQEHIIYLKDYEKNVQESDDAKLIVYDMKKAEQLDQIGVTLIKRNNTLYVKVDSNTYKRIKFINDDSEISLKDCHFHEDVIDVASFDYKSLEVTEKMHQPLSIKQTFFNAINQVKDVKLGGKMLYLVLAVIGVLMSISVGLIGHVNTIDPSDYAEFSEDLLTITGREWNYDDVELLESKDTVNYVNLITTPIAYAIDTEPYYQIKSSIELYAHPTPLLLFNEENLIYGEIPGSYGVIVSMSIAEDLIKNYADRGIESYDDILRLSFKLQCSGQDFYVGDQRSFTYPITGISDEPSRTVYMQEELIYSMLIPNVVDYRVLGEGVTVDGELSQSIYELTISEENSKIRTEVPSRIGISSGEYTVVGTYAYEKNGLMYDTNYLNLSHVDFIKEIYFNSYKSIYTSFDLFVQTNDVDQTEEHLALLGYNVDYEYDDNASNYQAVHFEENMALYIVGISGFIVGGISIFFIMRSSLLSRIYDIALYRALGVRKREIYKMFSIEIFLRTTLSATIGYFLTIILLTQAQSSVDQYVRFVNYQIGFTMIGLVALYLSLLIFGLLPVALEMRRTPANMFKKYDL